MFQLYFDRVAAAIGLLLCSPLLAAIAALVLLDDGRPILFSQMRVGRNGRLFAIWKFRSMWNRLEGSRLTAGGDPRVTRVGRFLRKYKLDELPQLWNVLTGDMGLVGPRPEVPEFVDLGDCRWQAVLGVRPGLTDLATLLYRNEEQILARYGDVERAYRENVLPSKLALNLEYLSKRSFIRDLKLLVLTFIVSVAPWALHRDPKSLRQYVLARD